MNAYLLFAMVSAFFVDAFTMIFYYILTPIWNGIANPIFTIASQNNAAHTLSLIPQLNSSWGTMFLLEFLGTGILVFVAVFYKEPVYTG